MFNVKRPDEATIQLIQRCGDPDRRIALRAQRELAVALENPLRQGVLAGDIVSGLFTAIPMERTRQSFEYPLDLLSPGEEDEHVAFTCPNNGRIPEAQVEGDYVMIPTYRIANSIDCLLKYLEEAGWDVLGRMMQVYEAGFVKKLNDDGWHTILAAAADRNILVYDEDATAGLFTKRLVSLMQIVMRRNGGGNSNSINRRSLTDIYISPEGLEDIRNWGVDQVDEITRREIFQLAGEKSLTRIFGVNLHDIDELGVNQEYQNFFTGALGASIQASDLELIVGVDATRGSFLMPVKEPLRTWEDPALHRSQRFGVYGWQGVGFGSLDSRDLIVGSFQ